MKLKTNIIQFMPYFPPHKGGVEIVGEEIGKYWVKKGYGKFINIIFSVGQEDSVYEYEKDGYKVYIIPAFDLINNFPFPKFWKKEFYKVFKVLKEIIGDNFQDFRVITHTRFFLSSLFGGIFARKNNIKWIHIEHGSSYAKLNSRLKSVISYLYDRLIGKWIFRKADLVLAISEACKEFILRKFVNRKVIVFYRGIDLNISNNKKNDELKIVFVGRLVFLKGILDLIKIYKKTGLKNCLVIIGDGEEKISLEKKTKGLNVNFLGYKNREYVIDFLSKNKCLFVNPSYSEGMPTSVMEALLSGNVVVASDVGGTREISNKDDLILFEAGDLKGLKKSLFFGIDNYDRLNGLSLELVKEKFSWERNIEKLYNLVR